MQARAPCPCPQKATCTSPTDGTGTLYDGLPPESVRRPSKAVEKGRPWKPAYKRSQTPSIHDTIVCLEHSWSIQPHRKSSRALIPEIHHATCELSKPNRPPRGGRPRRRVRRSR